MVKVPFPGPAPPPAATGRALAGLSPGERQAVLALLGRIGRDIPLVMIEHDMDLALDLADRVTVLHYGEVIAEATPPEIRADRTVQEIHPREDWRIPTPRLRCEGGYQAEEELRE